MTYEMNESNVITSITINGKTFECNIQTDGNWDVAIPISLFVKPEGSDTYEPVDITVNDMNNPDVIYNPDGTVQSEPGSAAEVVPNKYTFLWPKNSGYNMLHFWDAASSSYAYRKNLYGMPDANNYKIELPFDTVGICLCVDGKSPSHTQNWTFTTPGTYWYDEVAGTWSTKRSD